MKLLLTVGAAAVLVLGAASAAPAAATPASALPAISTNAEASSTAVLTIKAVTAGTGTNFSGTYRTTDGSAAGVAVQLQRKTPTGWDTVTRDLTDANGNLVYGTVHSNYVQTWRLVPDLAGTAPGYAISNEVHIAQNGRAVTRLTFPTPGVRAGKHVAFNGDFTYRSWWITSGPDEGREGWVAPLQTHLALQYRSGTTWHTKTTVLTEDRGDRAVDAYVDLYTNYSNPSTWRWYYPGSSTRLPAISSSLTR